MNLKTTSQLAIEAATIDAENKVELLGIQPLCESYKPYYFAIKNGVITNNNTFSKIFSTDDHFFYIIQQVHNDKIIKYERGIGRWFKQDKKFFLERTLPINYGGENIQQGICVNGCETFDCSECKHIVVQTSAPLTYAECLYSDNVLISSITPFLPHLVKVAPESLVGRLDSNLQSVSFAQLCDNKEFKNELISLLKKYNKQLSLECSRLSTKNISVNGIHINDNAEYPAKKNDIVCKGGKLKYYDGDKWYSIVMEEEK